MRLRDQFNVEEILNPPAFQFYADDFYSGTADMSQAEVGAYIRLLCQQWNRGSIPVEPEIQQRLAGGPVPEAVLRKFQKASDGVLRNKKLEEVRRKQREFSKSQSRKGLKSGEIRRNNAMNLGLTGVQPNGQPAVQTQSNSPISDLRSPKVHKNKGTIEEVKLFCAKVMLPESDAEWFFHKCEGNGWTNGGKPIRNWHATIRSWQLAGYMPSQKNGSTKISHTSSGGFD